MDATISPARTALNAALDAHNKATLALDAAALDADRAAMVVLAEEADGPVTFPLIYDGDGLYICVDDDTEQYEELLAGRNVKEYASALADFYTIDHDAETITFHVHALRAAQTAAITGKA